MALVSYSIPNLINGVSQQPPSLRLKTQATLQENGLSSVVQGLTKRPCSEHVANLGVIADAEDAFIHTIRRDDKEFYTLIVTNSSVRVFDEAGVERQVNGNASYLSGLTAPADDLAATTVADYTFILNKNTTVQATNDSEATRPYEGIVYVKQGDYRVNYTVKVTKNGTLYTRSIETMASTQDTTTGTSNAERSIQSDRIARNLRYNVATESTYYGATSAGSIPGLSITVDGNTISYKSTDGQDFQLDVEDSRGNQHIYAFKGTTADFKKLPVEAPLGFTIKVIGDNTKGQDDYFVKMTLDESGGYVWKECLRPGADIRLDSSTMPHQLISEADGTFTLQAMPLADRKVGDDDTNPFPSFTNEKISDIFFHRNRLGLLSGENVIFSEAGALDTFNFFLKTTLSILDTDVVDIAVSNNQVSILKHAVPFSDSLLLFSALTQFKLSAADLLTPSTVQINVATQFEASLESKPVGAGRYVFFGTSKGKWSGLREYFIDEDTQTSDAVDITAHVPQYIEGTIQKLEASSNEDMLLVLTNEAPNSLYVYRYYWAGTEKLQSAWSEWTFKGKVINASFNSSDLYVILQYADGTVCLERINLSEDEDAALTTAGFSVHLDRRVILSSANPTMPYTDNSIVYLSSIGSILSASQVTEVINNGGIVFAGIPYTFRYVFSEQVVKQDKDPLVTARMKIRNVSIAYNDTGHFETAVRPKYRTEKVSKFTGRIVSSGINLLNKVALETGTYRFNVLTDSKDVEIEIRSDSHLPCAFQSATFEGQFTLRSRHL